MQIRVAELPELTRSRLLAAVKNLPPQTFLLNESRRLWAAVGIVCASLSLAFVVSQADGYRWQPEDRVTYLLVVLASAIVLWISVTYLVRWFRHDFKANVLINPFYFLRFRFDRLEAIPLRTTRV